MWCNGIWIGIEDRTAFKFVLHYFTDNIGQIFFFFYPFFLPSFYFLIYFISKKLYSCLQKHIKFNKIIDD